MGDISKQHIINVLSFWHLPWKCEDLHNRDSEHLTTRPHTPHPHFRGHKGQVSCLKLKWSTIGPLSSSAPSVTFEDGADVLPDGDAAAAMELPQSQLHVEERHTSEHRHQQVG